MKVNLRHCIKQVASKMPVHGTVLEQFEQHIRQVIRGEATLQELADLYCLTDAHLTPASEEHRSAGVAEK